MQITDTDSARAWLHSWGGSPRRGILLEAIRGLRLVQSIMNGAPHRYSRERRLNNARALRVLRAALTRTAEKNPQKN